MPQTLIVPLDYAFDIETYVPITFEGETEFEFDVCDQCI